MTLHSVNHVTKQCAFITAFYSAMRIFLNCDIFNHVDLSLEANATSQHPSLP